MKQNTTNEIESGKTVLGVEFGSTRIKAVLLSDDHTPLASGSYEWENRYENSIWTYHLEDVWTGLQECYRTLSNDVLEQYNTPLKAIGALGFSAMMHGYLAFDKDANASVAVLWGEGGAFCAGWDLKYCASLVKNPGELHAIDYPLDDRRPIPRGPLGPTRLELDKPVIAAVAGPAVAGGFELALWCDVRVMEESAYFGVYCRRWGVPLVDGGKIGRAHV